MSLGATQAPAGPGHTSFTWEELEEPPGNKGPSNAPYQGAHPQARYVSLAPSFPGLFFPHSDVSRDPDVLG